MHYDESSIKSLDWREHIRLRPGMYIGKLGDGSSKDDGIYVLVKEVIDNSLDEHMMGYGKIIKVQITDEQVTVRDYGRGVPLGKVVDVASKINTGAKYDSKVFQKSVGLNGVGIKAVNALSDHFCIQSFRDGKTTEALFQKGHLIRTSKPTKTTEKNGTRVIFKPDKTVFKNYQYIPEYIHTLMWNNACLNPGLAILYNDQKFVSKNGLFDMLQHRIGTNKIRYPIIHRIGTDISIALTHSDQYGEEYYSFVNGQHTIQGGTHLAAFREGYVRGVRHFFKKDYDTSDIRAGIIAIVAVRIQDPIFESQTKTKLGSVNMSPGGASIKTYVSDYVAKEIEIYLHTHATTSDALLQRILQSERERKDIAGIKKLANERAKKANLHNRKLRDCRHHFNQKKDNRGHESMIFITEGDSASGSITKSRDVDTQAVFSLRGKPLNSYNLTKKIVYENEEFNLLQHALNIEAGHEGLRYSKIIIATDADVDGMHIRLLLMTFFLQFFPELVHARHLYILETPLFRIRNKKKTHYCYTHQEKLQAIEELGENAEITRFKGLGEISPEEFGAFIGNDIRLQPITIDREKQISEILTYYMGKNTPERQAFIIDHLRIEENQIEVLEKQ